jgi:hypothetical protein
MAELGRSTIKRLPNSKTTFLQATEKRTNSCCISRIVKVSVCFVLSYTSYMDLLTLQINFM